MAGSILLTLVVEFSLPLVDLPELGPEGLVADLPKKLSSLL
jgi:hypothetical protein